MKTLEEFIEKYQHPSDREAMRIAAAEILRVCEEWLFADDVDWPGFDIEKNRVTRMQICVASELYDFLKSYIQPVKKESEDE